MKIIRKWLSSFKEKNKSKRISDIERQFKVVERNGILYLTLCGVAFRIISNDTSASDIAEMLSKARRAAIEFEMI